MANYLIDTKDFTISAGYGIDARVSLQNAINSAASAGKGLILTKLYGASLNPSQDGVLSLPSNTNLVFAPGAGLRLLPHNADIYHMLICDGVSNVTIESAWLDGAKEENSSTTGEYGMGISLYDSSNITMRRCTIVNT